MKEYVYKGQVYPSINRLAQATTISNRYLTKMLKQLPETEGRIVVDQLIDEYLAKRDRTYQYQGEIYHSKAEAAKALGLSYETLTKYLDEAKDDLEKAIELYQKNHEVLIIDGEKYTGKKEIAKSLGVTFVTLSRYIDKEGSIEAAVKALKKNKQESSVVWKGEKYPTLAHAVRAMGADYTTIRNYVTKQTNGDLDEAYRLYQENTKYKINGKTYCTIQEMLKDLDIPGKWYYNTLPEYQYDALKTIYALIDRRKVTPKRQYDRPKGGYIYKEKVYQTVYPLARETGISPQLLKKMAKQVAEKDGRIELDRPIDEYLKKRDVIWVYNGEPYNTIRALSVKTGIAEKTLYRILKPLGKSSKTIMVDDAIEEHLEKKYTYSYLGKPYATIKALANEVGIDIYKLGKAVRQCDRNAEKAIMMIKTRESRKKKLLTKNGSELSLADMATILGVTQEELNSCFGRGMNIDQIKKHVSGKKTNKSIRGTGSSVLMYDEKTSLAEYCIKNKFNYSCIYYMVTEYGKTIPEAINHYQMNGQELPSDWIHERYDILLKHLLLDAKMDYQKVIKAMRQHMMPMREALEYVVVRDDAKEKDLDPEWQHEIYSIYTDTGLSEVERQECVKAFYITPKEIEVIEKSKEKVVKLERQLDLYEIAESIRDQLFTEEETAELMNLYKVSDQERKTIFYDFYVKFKNGVLQTDKEQEELKNNKSLMNYATEMMDRYAKLMKHGQADSKEEMTQSPLKNGEENPHP